jgi:hypothetical protein
LGEDGKKHEKTESIAIQARCKKGQSMIHKVGNAYVISSNQVAIPGCYDSERAAKYAFRFSDEDLQLLQDQVNKRESCHKKRLISFEMLQSLVKSRKVYKHENT